LELGLATTAGHALTLASDSPNHIVSSSGPLTEMKLAWHSFAMAYVWGLDRGETQHVGLRTRDLAVVKYKGSCCARCC
jgi:hypothetical protein